MNLFDQESKGICLDRKRALQCLMYGNTLQICIVKRLFFKTVLYVHINNI